MAKPKPSSTAVASRPSTAVASAIDFSADAGAGFESAGREAFAIPFLTILQSGSPQCKRSDGAYIKGAEEGMLYNTVTNELFASDTGVEIIPCAYTQTFVEWGLREAGGGLIAEYDAVAGAALRQQARRDDKNREILPNGHQLNDTRNHYVLFKDGDGFWQPALMSMTSTQLKASRNWMSTMQRLCTTHKVPMFALRFLVTTAAQQNEKGTWYGYAFEYLGLVEDEEAYALARGFYQQAKAGQIRTQPREGEHSTPTNRDHEHDPDEM